jgi:DNA-binding beta-propeller fold protein YncE
VSSRGGTRLTRRGLLGTTAATGVAYAFAQDAPAQAAVPLACELRPPGVRRSAVALSPSRRTLWTADITATAITAYRARDLRRLHSIEVGVAPSAIALHPNGHQALVVAGLRDRAHVAVVDLFRGRVARRIEIGPVPAAAAYGPGGHGAWIAGGDEHGWLRRIEPATGRVRGPLVVGSHPRDVVVEPDGDHALVALNGEAAVCRIALKGDHASHRIATAPFPRHLAVAADGERACVSHAGFGDDRVTILDLGRARVAHVLHSEHEPAGLALDRSGALLAVAGSGGGTIAVHDARSGRRRRRLRVGGWPQAVVLTGGRVIAVDGQTGELAAVRS